MRVAAAAWFVLALATLYFVVVDDGYGAGAAAVVAWMGGLVTGRMWRVMREGETIAP